MNKISDLKLFFSCVFGFILLITGFALWEYAYVPYYNCLVEAYVCYHSFTCHDNIDCSYYASNGNAQNGGGIFLMVLGPLLVACSFPVLTQRLLIRSREETQIPNTQLNTTPTDHLGQEEKRLPDPPLGSEVVIHK